MTARTTVSLVFASASVVIITYVSYKLTSFWRNIRRIGSAMDQLPGDSKHWLWGTLDRVLVYDVIVN